MSIRHILAILALSLVATPGMPALAADQLPVPVHGVVGITPAQLEVDFWLKRLSDPDHVIMDADAVRAYGARVQKLDPYVYDLRALPAQLDGAKLREWITPSSPLTERTLYDVHGEQVPAATLQGFVDALALDAIPDRQKVGFGLVVHRAAVRSYPTTLRVFSHKGDTDIDRFQETALVPGTPVAVLHESADGQWLYVEAPRYRAWVQAKYIATGDKGEVLDYAGKAPFLVVTGDSVRTVFTREEPRVSKLQLDMGTRVPFDPSWPDDKPVNGQGPYASHVVKLPVRNDDGSLGFRHALLQKNTDTRDHYLPLTQANITRQAFKFLGERYGWGHSYDGRDCSGFVSDVYRSMGIVMPRNTSAQSVSPAADLTSFDEHSSHAERMKAVEALQTGDLIYIPGHVMMMLGRLHGQPYVIQDVLGAGFFDEDGQFRHVKLNQVAVTPLLPLMNSDHKTWVDRMTAIVRIRPQP